MFLCFHLLLIYHVLRCHSSLDLDFRSSLNRLQKLSMNGSLSSKMFSVSPIGFVHVLKIFLQST